jgi:hypothetical protein
MLTVNGPRNAGTVLFVLVALKAALVVLVDLPGSP